MHSGKTISLKTILWRVMTHPLMQDLTYDDAAMYATEAIGLIGSALSFNNKIKYRIPIVNYKGRLPDNLINIRGVRTSDNYNVLTYASDIYIQDHCRDDFKEKCNYSGDLTYEVSQNVITTSFKEGKVDISYKALPVDKDGYPLIQNNPKNIEAIRYHIMNAYLEPLYHIGKITDKAYQDISQKRDWYVGAAQTSMQLQGIDHLETTMRSINRLLTSNDLGHPKGFKNLSSKENYGNNE